MAGCEGGDEVVEEHEKVIWREGAMNDEGKGPGREEGKEDEEEERKKVNKIIFIKIYSLYIINGSKC